jgi:hypothetical protein
MVGVAVVVADDVESRCVCLALDPDVVPRVDLIPIASPLDDDVAGALDLGHRAVAARPDHDPADLVWITLGAVCAYRVESLLPDLHFLRP